MKINAKFKKINISLFKTQKGFTLAELMVVVAIIGLLSTVAIPNYKKYVAKAKTSEAKLHLALMYTSQESFSAEKDIYSFCWRDMGYDPSPEVSQRYYAVGFQVMFAPAALLQGVCLCNGACPTSEYQYPAGKSIGDIAPFGSSFFLWTNGFNRYELYHLCGRYYSS